VLAAPDLQTARPVLPTNHLTLTAWVLLEETASNGGIVGFVQDNGPFEKGWVLGYNRQNFTFGLAGSGAKDPNLGGITRLRGRKKIETGRWHHVAATYDGTTMKLFVDGEPDGESTQQSGDILYPAEGRLAVGAYVDQDERHPMEGSLFEVKAYGRVMPADEIRGIAERNQSLLAWRSPVNRELQFAAFKSQDAFPALLQTHQDAFFDGPVAFLGDQPARRLWRDGPRLPSWVPRWFAKSPAWAGPRRRTPAS
jgi:hypothetical protein